MINLIETATTMTVSVKGHRPFFIPLHEKEKVEAVKNFYRNNDLNGLIDFLDKRQRIVSWSDGVIYVEGDEVKIQGDDTAIPSVIANKIIEFYQQKLPYQFLVNFWLNLRKNPSQDSINQLYGFLEKNHHPITPDGKFIAYKKVTRLDDGRLVDTHTRKISNEIGDIVQMNRDNVDPNPNSTCSYGLHVASWNYASGYAGNVLVAVEVHPKDVVAVPVDYQQQKMRTCEYKVIEIYEDTKPIDSLVYDNTEEDDDIFDGEEDDNDINFDEYDLTDMSYENIENVCRNHQTAYGYYPRRKDYANGKNFISAATQFLVEAGFVVTNRYGTYTPGEENG